MIPDVQRNATPQQDPAPPLVHPTQAVAQRPSLTSLLARILGVAIGVVGSALLSIGVINLNSETMALVALGVVAMIAAILVHSWWALLVVPLADTIGWTVTALGWFVVEGLSHGAEIHDSGQLAVGLLTAALYWGMLPAAVGALAGTLAWRGWQLWSGH